MYTPQLRQQHNPAPKRPSPHPRRYRLPFLYHRHSITDHPGLPTTRQPLDIDPPVRKLLAHRRPQHPRSPPHLRPNIHLATPTHPQVGSLSPPASTMSLLDTGPNTKPPTPTHNYSIKSRHRYALSSTADKAPTKPSKPTGQQYESNATWPTPNE
ncbi:Uncharacterised protein [Corynebacterium kutscheri]|nr:Uncharacterised protein [Corynebacterium kutscheri]